MSEWIPVKDKLPTVGDRVICCGTRGSVFEGTFVSPYYPGECALFKRDKNRKALTKCTYWMPLPEAPHED